LHTLKGSFSGGLKALSCYDLFTSKITNVKTFTSVLLDKFFVGMNQDCGALVKMIDR